VVVLGLLAVACAAGGEAASPSGTAPTAPIGTASPSGTSTPPGSDVAAPDRPRPPPGPFAATSTIAPKDLLAVAPATCGVAVAERQNAPTAPADTVVLPPIPPETTTTTAPPIDAPTALERLRRDPRVGGGTVSASVWVDGLGEVAAANPDTALVPASNQKLLTAIGALRLLDPQERLHTDLIATGPIEDGVLRGDLVLVGGGDATLTRLGPHSLEALGHAVTDAGVHAIEGRLLVDSSRYDDERTRPAWPGDWWQSVGPPSALVADRNNYRKDQAFLEDPALANAQLLEFALTSAGVTFGAPAGHGSTATGVTLASLESPTVNELVTVMLLRSDNLIAELFVKEIGFRATHQPGSTDAGLHAIDGVLQQLCVQPLTGTSADGSGLSRDDHRSARELRRLLLAASLQPWGALFQSDISVAGQPGALGGRLTGPDTSGNVRAKGGSLAITRSLSGYLTTRSGRHAVFSVIINGPSVGGAELAIDDFVTALAQLRT
jgi:D-alanyl-D-alanine carboxypeptidase/D-alanyl-D-alanine-endopeptidase (penicillin-binding protein 4)